MGDKMYNQNKDVKINNFSSAGKRLDGFEFPKASNSVPKEFIPKSGSDKYMGLLNKHSGFDQWIACRLGNHNWGGWKYVVMQSSEYATRGCQSEGCTGFEIRPASEVLGVKDQTLHSSLRRIVFKKGQGLNFEEVDR